MAAPRRSTASDKHPRAGRPRQVTRQAARLAALLERLPELANRDRRLVWEGRFFSADLLLGIDGLQRLLSVREGRVTGFERGPLLMRSWCFAIRASAQAWSRFWQPVPAPGWHDLFALTKRGAASVEGELTPLMANLQYVKDLLALPRRLVKST